MPVRNTAARVPDQSDGKPVRNHAADVAYQRAWWVLVLYPLTFAAAFAIGEGMISLLTGTHATRPSGRYSFCPSLPRVHGHRNSTTESGRFHGSRLSLDPGTGVTIPGPVPLTNPRRCPV